MEVIMSSTFPTSSNLLGRTFLTSIFMLCFVGSASAQSPSSGSTQRSFVVTTKDVKAGQVSGITMKLSDDSDLTDSGSPDITVESLNASQLTVENPHLSPDKKRLLFTVRVAPDAFGPATLRVLKGNQKTPPLSEVDFIELNIAEFQANPIPRKPTPSGIRRVDLMWSVLPDGIIKDNFGSKTAKNYYGIQVVIGNNTGFDLQIVSMGFKTTLKIPELDAELAEGQHAKSLASLNLKSGLATDSATGSEASKKIRTFEIPVLDHRLVRGTIEKEQVFGKRAKALGFVTGIGTLTTGFLPFFRAVGPRANFSSFTSLLNGNFKEGFGLTIPDLTVRQLSRLENQVMHDELIVPNNSQERTVVFLPKGIFDLSDEANLQDKRNSEPSIPTVMALLGELKLVGRKIEYIDVEDREIVVARSEGRHDDEPPALPSPNPSASSVTPAPATLAVTGISPNGGLALETNLIRITGANFSENCNVTFGDTPAAAVKFISPTTLNAFAPAHAPGDVEVAVIRPNGEKVVSPQKYTYFSELIISGSDRSSGLTAGGETVRIFGSGIRANAKVFFDGLEISAGSVTVASDGRSIAVKTPAHVASKVKVSVVNPSPYPNQEARELVGGFTYNP